MGYGKLGVEVVKAYIAKKKQNSHSKIKLSEEWANMADKLNLSNEHGCPKATFLGICSAGYVSGIPAFSYTDSYWNSLYGETAIQLLKTFPYLANLGTKELWIMVLSIMKPFYKLDITKTHNQQMDVILELWNKGYIK